MEELSPAILDAIADALAKRLAERWGISPPIVPSRPELVDVYDLAEAVGLSVPTINRAVAAGTIPSIQAGRRRLFAVTEVLEAIRKAGEHLTPKRPKPENDQSPAAKTRGARS